MDTSKILVELSLQNTEYLKKIQQSLDATKGFAQKSSESVSEFGSSLSHIVSAGAVIGALSLAFAHAIKETVEFQKAQTQLDAVLQSTNGAAGVTAERANKLAEEYEKLTTVQDDTIVQAEVLLLRFTNIKDNVFPQATLAALNLSAALGKDLNSAAMMVGRALQDPINGMTALRKAGVQLSAQTQQQVSSAMQLGDVYKAQTILLAELEKRYGGTAAAAANTLEGALNRVKNSMAKLAQSTGNEASPGIISLSEAFERAADKGGLLQSLATNLGILFGKMATAAAALMDKLDETYRRSAKTYTTQREAEELLMYGGALEGTETAESEKVKAAEPKTIGTKTGYDLGKNKAADAYAREQEAAMRKLDEYLARNEADSYDRRMAVAQLHYQEMSDIAQKYITDEQKKNDALLKMNEEYQEQQSRIETKYVADKIKMGIGYVKDAMQIANALNEYEQQKVQQRIRSLDQHASVFMQTMEAQKKQETDAVNASADSEEEKKKKLDAINKKYGQQEYTVQLAIAFMRYNLQKAAFEQQQKFQEAQIWIQAAAGAVGVLAQSLIQFGIWGLIPGALGAAAMFALAGIEEATIQSQHAPPFQPPAAPSYAAGAWDIPENQYALLHKKEMVVSAPFAEKFRENAGGVIHIHNYLGGKEVDGFVYDSLKRTAARVGGRPLNFKVA